MVKISFITSITGCPNTNYRLLKICASLGFIDTSWGTNPSEVYAQEHDLSFYAVSLDALENNYFELIGSVSIVVYGYGCSTWRIEKVINFQ